MQHLPSKPSRLTAPHRVSSLGLLALALAALAAAWAGSGAVTTSQPTIRLTPVVSRVQPGVETSSAGATPDSDTEPTTDAPLDREQAQHLAHLGIPRWHAAGYRGQGVKVAVLDSGFRGYHKFLGDALPARVTAKSFRHDGNLEAKDSQHGIWCAAVVHTVVPDAELLLANWEPDAPEQFLAAVRWARQMGARVLTCSVIMPSWSDGEGGGAVNAELARILGTGGSASDVLCFASAGNTALRHWHGTFHDGGDRVHEWRPGQKDNLITPWGKERVAFEVCWRDGADYDLTIIDDTNGATVAQSLARVDKSRSCAVARFTPTASHTYRVRLRLASGPGGSFHAVALGGGLKFATSRGSIPCPADGPAVIAVGAVDRNGCRACYSSCGPNSKQPKPDFVAPVPFPGAWRSKPFTGTSAAAPQAAAVAALLWSRHLEQRADQVCRALRASARDLCEPGHDCETGYGEISLPALDQTLAR